MAAANTVKGQQAIFSTGGIQALSTAYADLSPAITSKKQKLKSLTMTADATCTVVLLDSGAVMAPLAFGLLANTPRTIDENALQDLFQTAAGGSIQVKATTGTPNLTASGIVDLE
jgi:hypothetical protein